MKRLIKRKKQHVIYTATINGEQNFHNLSADFACLVQRNLSVNYERI